MQQWSIDQIGDSCLCCGSHITPQFRRGFGDDKDRAHRCPTCDTHERIASGSAAGKHVRLPDPLDDPSRFPETVCDLPSHVKSLIQCRSESAEIATDGGEDH